MNNSTVSLSVKSPQAVLLLNIRFNVIASYLREDVHSISYERYTGISISEVLYVPLATSRRSRIFFFVPNDIHHQGASVSVLYLFYGGALKCILTLYVII